MDANITTDAVLQGIAIQLDAGMTYVGCRFVRCNIGFAGNPVAVRLEGNTFEACNWNFMGPAGNTINFLKAMYANGQKDIVEQIFQTIRTPSPQPAVLQPAPPSSSGPGTIH
jgi:hypothetical protein